MSITSELEEKFGTNFVSTMSPDEKQTYFTMLKLVSESQLSLPKLKEYIHSLRDTVERELINEPEFKWRYFFKVPNRKQIFLKARLQNYMLLEAFLTSEKKAREALDSMLSNLKVG